MGLVPENTWATAQHEDSRIIIVSKPRRSYILGLRIGNRGSRGSHFITAEVSKATRKGSKPKLVFN